MIIKKCYIENFGVLSKRAFDFDSGLTEICEENGMGKSTLAVFIKAMLFGFDKNTRKDLDENERKKYKPWQKGNYGGYLDFEVKGKLYRIEKSFDDTEGDRVRLIDLASGGDTEDFDKDNLGASIFGIDEGGYEKSAYLSQRDPSCFKSDRLYTKLSDLLEEENDMGSYEDAMKLLEEAESPYKKRGGNDRITAIENEISQALSDLAAAEKHEELLSQAMPDKDALSKKLEVLEAEQKKANAEYAAAIEWEKYKRYKQAKDSYEAAIKDKSVAEATFNGKIPTSDELDDIERKLKVIDLEQSKHDEAKAELKEAQNKQNLLSAGETPEQKRIIELKELLFKEGLPAEGEIDEAIKAYRKSSDLKARLSEPLPPYKPDYKKLFLGSKVALSLAIVGVIVLIAGILIEILADRIAGKVVYAAGILSFAAGAYIVIAKYLKGKNEHSESHKKSVRGEYDIEEKKVRDFLARYGMTEKDPFEAIMQISKKLSEYVALSEKVSDEAKEAAEKIEELTLKIAEAENKIIGLKTEVSLYLRERGEEADDLYQAYKNLRDRLNIYEIRRGIEVAAKRNLENCEKPEREFEDTQQEYDTRELRQTLNKLSADIDETRKALIRLDNDIAYHTDYAAQKCYYKEKTETLKERLKKEKYYRGIVQKTKACLEKAKNNLAEKYIGEIRYAFGRYLSVVTGKKIEVLVNQELGYEIHEGGQYRDIKYFSRGYRDLFDICQRLALADALFKDEKPFLILDDPFKNLDDKKMQAANKLLAEIASKYQVIYFVCHTSRKLGLS